MGDNKEKIYYQVVMPDEQPKGDEYQHATIFIYFGHQMPGIGSSHVCEFQYQRGGQSQDSHTRWYGETMVVSGLWGLGKNLKVAAGLLSRMDKATERLHSKGLTWDVSDHGDVMQVRMKELASVGGIRIRWDREDAQYVVAGIP